MLWKALAALLLAAAGATSAVAASAGGNSGPAPADALAQEVRGWVEVVAASGAAPALAVAIVRPGQPDALITAGVPYSGAVDAIDEHTVFRLASVSKALPRRCAVCWPMPASWRWIRAWSIWCPASSWPTRTPKRR